MFTEVLAKEKSSNLLNRILKIIFTLINKFLASIFMKQLIFLVLLVTNGFGFSQTSEPNEFKDKYEEFDYYAQPNKKNELSRYFRSHINTELLDAVKFKNDDTNKQRVFLSFRLSSKGNPIGITVNTPYSELNTNIIEAFKNYNIERFNIPKKNRLNTYVLQIVSTENGKTIVNCSTHIIYDRFPVFEGCEYIKGSLNMKPCINRLLESHVVKNISHTEIMNAKVIGFIRLEPKFIINKEGNIEQIKSKAPTENLRKELNRIMAFFPKAITPPTRNGKPTNLFYNGFVGLQIDSNGKKYEDDLLKSKDSLLKPDNELALHFKKHLSEKEINNITFFKKSKRITISFSIDKKGRIIDVESNGYNVKMNNRLIQIFKKFPFEKLNIKSTNVLTQYSYNVISKIGSRNIIECNDQPNTFIMAIFNKKCAKSKSRGALKKCFSENVSDILNIEFDNDMRHKTKLKGDIRTFTTFQVNALGEIENVKVRAPNPYIANEIEKILNAIPNVLKPAYFNGKAVKMPFTLPVRFRVGENKPEDPYKGLSKMRN